LLFFAVLKEDYIAIKPHFQATAGKQFVKKQKSGSAGNLPTKPFLCILWGFIQ